MMRLILAILCFLQLGIGACYGQKYNTIYIAPSSSSSPPTILEGYAKANQILQWKVLDQKDNFTIQFVDTDPPCKPPADAAALTAYANHPATCKVKLPKGYTKGDVLRFEYQLIDNNHKHRNVLKLFQHVGSCDTCLDSSSPGLTANSTPAPPAPPAPLTIPKDHTETLSCISPYITPNVSLDVTPSDRVFWQNPNGESKPSWTITFDDPTACKDPVTFAKPVCKVTGTIGTKYTYHVKVGNGQAPNGCQFDGYINVVQP